MYEEIANELKPQGVVKVERMKRTKDGQLIPANSYILTVEIQTIPREMKVGFLNKALIVQVLDTTNGFAARRTKFANCGQENHEDKDCEK